MSKLPKNFPEFSIMYRTIKKKISELKKEKEIIQDENIKKDINNSIEKYQKELDKIESQFPKDFFRK